MEPKVYVNVEKSIRESGNGFLTKLPNFAVKRLAKIVKEKELNAILNKTGHLEGTAFLTQVLKELNINLVVEGEENLPENGRCFFAANHPFGILDGCILTHVVSRKYGTLKAIANDAFGMVPQLKPFMAEVNVYGNTAKAHIESLNKTYASDEPITHFPAGEVSRVYHGKIQDAPWQKSFIAKAISNKRDIVPIYFEGQNSKLFYRIYKVRSFFGLGMNLELALLPREFFRSANTTVRVVIGKPISYTHFTKEKTHVEWAQWVRQYTYNLGS